MIESISVVTEQKLPPKRLFERLVAIYIKIGHHAHEHKGYVIEKSWYIELLDR